MDGEKFKHSCRKRLKSLYNIIPKLKPPKPPITTDLPALNDLKKHRLRRTAINEHLETLFVETLTMNPRLIVELGWPKGRAPGSFPGWQSLPAPDT